eukprot:CAMPEP_0196182678 /NCGR_PEP_ID=MMETSP0911-20130528/29999_1 /TAXON_ID=49265 /ORGANISM="Thalassiosira rotula, Strain GSO102" /LENGTH=106 /DNA_ID=CAMNT_0041452413 /DNA_START=105 /DNA_END=426 /DNA_ORIENTATION=+
MTPGVSVGDGLFFLHGGYQCVTHWQMNEWDNVVDGHQAIEPCAVLSRNYGLDDQRGTLALGYALDDLDFGPLPFILLSPHLSEPLSEDDVDELLWDMDDWVAALLV